MNRESLERLRAELSRVSGLAHAGARRAADALALLLGHPVRTEPPRVRLAPRRGEPDRSSLAALGADATGIFFEVAGGPGGVFAVLLPRRGREVLLFTLQGDPEPRSEEAESALREVGNILVSHALSAVADQVGERVLPSLPVLALAGAGAVLAAHQMRGEPVRVESRLVAEDGALRALLVWIPAALVVPAAAPGV
jgi:chemotaxis protein CheC